MATPAYNQTLDTLVSTALETYTRNPANALTNCGEKFLQTAARMGRLFVVNDAETLRHPLLIGHGENSSLYTPDTLSGTPDGENNLSASAKEILTMAMFHLVAGTRNINFPQSQPPGNLIDYVSSVVDANMMKVFNEEEILFVQGDAPGSSGTLALNAPMTTDTDYNAGYPMSLMSLLYSSSTPAAVADGDTTNESFANVKVDDVPKWQPKHTAATDTDHSTMVSDLQNIINDSSYSGVERPTHVYMVQESFEKFLALHRTLGALPDPVQANLGKEGSMPFGGVTVDWSRYLTRNVLWDITDPEGGTASYPIVGVNWNSLRLNTVRAGSPSQDNLGFIRQIGAIQTHPLLTNLFKRIEWKRQWSVDAGRRSFFSLYGNTTIA